MLFTYTLRRERRGNASFAVVAVGLLIAGGATALFLHTVEDRSLAEGPSDDQVLLRGARQETAVLTSIATALLEGQLKTQFDAGDGAVSRASANFSTALGARLTQEYPRTNSQGARVSVSLAFARIVAEQERVEIGSPLGGTAQIDMPAFLAVEAGAEVSVEAPDGANATVFVVFGGRCDLPVLLPLSLAARVAGEASYGGRVERLVGQALNSTLSPSSHPPFTPARVPEIVRFGLEAELALEFGVSGNASLDERLSKLQAAAGAFDVTDFYGPKAYYHESYPLALALRAIRLGDGQAAVRFTLRNVSTASLSTNLSWVTFDSQEAGGGDRGAATLSVSGEVSFEALLDAPGALLDLGRTTIPVSFRARAYGIGLNANLSVPPGELRAALDDLESNGSTSRFALPAVLGEAVGVFSDYNFTNASRNGTIVGRVADFLAQARRAGLPPVEDGALFAEMFGPSSWSVTGGQVALSGPWDVNGSRAEITLDGVPVASRIVNGGAIDLARFPQGRHTLAVRVDTPEGIFSGSLTADFGAATFDLMMELLPVASSMFLQAVFARANTAGAGAAAGWAGLAEAGAFAGLSAPAGFQTSEEAKAFARLTLERLEAMLGSPSLSGATRERADDARAFSKIVVLVLDAIDELKSLEDSGAVPFAPAAKAGAQLVLEPDAEAALGLTYAGYKVAGAALTENGVVVKVYGESHAVASLRVGMSKFGLVMEALVGAGTIAADFVEIRNQLDEGDERGAVMASAKFGADLGKLTLAFAKLEYRMAGKVAAKAAEKTMVRAALVTAAAALIVDLAVLYHDHNGNLTEMGAALVHPGTADGVLDLPFLAMGAVELALTAYFVAMGATAAEISAVAGPLGVAAALFVLAALLVVNKETVACAIYGTICLSSLDPIRNETGKAVGALFNASAYANGFDFGQVALAARTASAAAVLQWRARMLDPSADAASAARIEESLRGQAQRASAVESAARALRHAAAAAVEQLDDFASGPLVNAEGRSSEGYGSHCTPIAGCFHFAGDVVVLKRVGSSWDMLGRWRWRPLMASVTAGELSQYVFAFALTEANAIDVGEYQRWSSKAGSAIQRVSSAFDELVRAQAPLAGPR